MTPAEQLARVVLRTAAVYDPRFREPDPAIAAAWAGVLAGLDPDRVVAAVNEHYRTSTETLMPAHVTELVHRVGGSADRHPSAKSAAEALATIERGPGDRLAADRDQPVPAIEGPAPRSGRDALTAAQAWAQQRPTGYERRRRPHAPGMAADTSKRLAADQRTRDTKVVDGRTDAARAKAGKAITICHACAVDIPAPSGWDPASVDSPALFCGHCRPAEARNAS